MLEYSSSYVLQLKQKLSPDACMHVCLYVQVPGVFSSLLFSSLGWNRSGAKREKDNVEVVVAFSFLVAS